jgi:hypothetical protein
VRDSEKLDGSSFSAVEEEVDDVFLLMLAVYRRYWGPPGAAFASPPCIVCAVGNSATFFPRIACERKIYSRSFCAPGADKCSLLDMPRGIDIRNSDHSLLTVSSVQRLKLPKLK